MKTFPLYIEFSPEIQKVIADNRVSVGDQISNEIHNVKTTYQTSPFDVDVDDRDKDLVLTILASSGLILSIGIAISKILRAFYRKPFLVEFYDIVEAIDHDGRVLKDRRGNPILRSVKRYELIEPRPDTEKANAEFSWSESKGVVIKYGSVNDQKSMDK